MGLVKRYNSGSDCPTRNAGPSGGLFIGCSDDRGLEFVVRFGVAVFVLLLAIVVSVSRRPDAAPRFARRVGQAGRLVWNVIKVPGRPMEGGGARPSWGVMTLQKRHATRHRRMSLRCRTYNARGTMLVLCPGGFFDEAYGGAASATSPYPRIEIRAAVTVIPKIRAAFAKPRRMNADMMITPSCKFPLPQHSKHNMGQS
jgi:hypothetical protein